MGGDDGPCPAQGPSPVKIGIHADPINHQIPGGVGVYVRRLVEQILMLEAASSIRLLAAKPIPADPAQWWKPNWHRPDNPMSSLSLAALYASWNYLGVPSVGAELDVVHATGLVVPPARGARLVATIHDLAVEKMPEVVPSPWRQIYRRGLRKALAQAAVFCVVSEAVKQELASDFGVDPARMRVTHEAPNVTPADYRDEEWFNGLGIDGPFILTVGTVEPRKNQKVLVRALARAGRRLGSYRLVIAGAPGWGQAELMNEIEESSMGERVVVTGGIGASALACLYSRASIFAFPSAYEGFGIPLTEALGFGIPSIASQDAALREVAGGAAVHLEANDADAWADGLANLAGDPDRREELSREGQNRAAAFNWRTTAAKTMEAYRQAASL